MRTIDGKFPKVALLLAVLVILATGCLKTEKFPVEPKIEFKSFERFSNDSASLVIKFTDGDGDIGLEAADTFPPYETNSAFYNNLLLKYFELTDGEWNEVELPEPIGYRIPRITPNGQNKTLEGEIAIAIDPFSLFILTDSGTVRYSVEILDRALNRSNLVYTSGITVP